MRMMSGMRRASWGRTIRELRHLHILNTVGVLVREGKTVDEAFDLVKEEIGMREHTMKFLKDRYAEMQDKK